MNKYNFKEKREKEISEASVLKNNQSFVYEQFLIEIFKRSVREYSIDFGDFKIGNLISTGSSCQVYEGKYRNQKMAVKHLQKSKDKKTSKKFEKEFKREVGILIALPSHQNLMRLQGFCIDKNSMYILSELLRGGCLFDKLHSKKNKFKFTILQKIKILLDISKGMEFLHKLKNPIIHRDLKTLNILFDQKIKAESLNFTSKIIDFGISKS